MGRTTITRRIKEHCVIQEFSLDLIGFGDFTFDIETPLLGDEDEIPTDVETKVKRGDVWQLGEHRLMCGDSLSVTDVEKLMGGNHRRFTLHRSPLQYRLCTGRQAHWRKEEL
jgi:hypothetical protein